MSKPANKTHPVAQQLEDDLEWLRRNSEPAAYAQIIQERNRTRRQWAAEDARERRSEVQAYYGLTR